MASRQMLINQIASYQAELANLPLPLPYNEAGGRKSEKKKIEEHNRLIEEQRQIIIRLINVAQNELNQMQ